MAALGHGVRLHGEVGELWLYGMKAGLVYRWRFDGWKADWRMEAERYKLDPLLYRGERREIQVRLPVHGNMIIGKGIVWNDCQADNKTHRGLVVKGTSLSWQKTRAALAQTGT